MDDTYLGIPRYYSQSGEDAMLWELFRGRTRGFFIEIGAFDGRYLSNTLSFEQQGWNGLCVEPIPEFAELCRQNRPRSFVVQAACVGPDEGKVAHLLREPLGLLSGIRANETPNIADRYVARGMVFPGFTTIEVPARTLDEILAECPPPDGLVDFISIDVEGTEIDVLRGFNFPARIIIAEANTPAAARAVQDYLVVRGYMLSRKIEQNLFFSRSAEDDAILKAAEFTIKTELVSHPLGGRATLAGMTGKVVRVASNAASGLNL
jgi:FkbM family methyltransferase